jgi:hypothetical protein
MTWPIFIGSTLHITSIHRFRALGLHGYGEAEGCSNLSWNPVLVNKIINIFHYWIQIGKTIFLGILSAGPQEFQDLRSVDMMFTACLPEHSQKPTRSNRSSGLLRNSYLLNK